MLEIQASELIINLSNQKKAGTLMLAMYNSAEAFEGSVSQGEEIRDWSF